MFLKHLRVVGCGVRGARRGAVRGEKANAAAAAVEGHLEEGKGGQGAERTAGARGVLLLPRRPELLDQQLTVPLLHVAVPNLPLHPQELGHGGGGAAADEPLAGLSITIQVPD